MIKEGSKIAILFHGSASIEAITACELLQKQHIFPKLISVPMLQPLDKKVLKKMLDDVDYIISVEEHYTYCGLGDILSKFRNEINAAWQVIPLGFPFQFVHEIKDTNHMRDYFGFSAKKIVQTINKITKV
jgi:transketolase C-terminal domain/subunit